MFQNMTDIYDAMIDWPKRLAHEAPFYRQLFEEHHVRSVLDAACGTGRHAAMFHAWGLQVEGADLSEAMIARAKKQFGEPDGLRWTVRGFDQPIASAGPFDAVICVGNSLPLAPDMETVERAVARMLAAIRPGGLLMVHALNLWRLPDGPCVWQKSIIVSDASGEKHLILKGVHRCGTRGYVELLVADPQGNAPLQTECAAFLGLEAERLASMAATAGAADVRFFGGYGNEPYDREKSVDLLLVAPKP